MHCYRWLMPAVFAIAMVLPATSGALMITINSGSWDLGSGWGPACTDSYCNGEGDTGSGANKVEGAHTLLNMDWDIVLSSQSFDLANVGDSMMVDFGTGTFIDEDGTLAAAETNDLGIAAILDLSVQSGVINTGTVTTVTGGLNDNTVDLAIAFAPVNVLLDDGTAFTIDLADPSWTCNPGTQDCSYPRTQSSTISATFKLTSLPVVDVLGSGAVSSSVASIPEPGILALLATGLFGMGIARRRCQGEKIILARD